MRRLRTIGSVVGLGLLGCGGLGPSDPPSAERSSVSAFPTTMQTSQGETRSTITVTARDTSGNAIPGATVVIAATGTGNTLNQPVGTTNARGVATGTLSSTAAGTKTITSSIDGTNITQNATVNVTAAAVSVTQSTVNVSPEVGSIGV